MCARGTRRRELRVRKIKAERVIRTDIAFSSVLIGTDGGAFTGVTDSIQAIVRAAVDVNRALSDAQLADRIWIDRIEFIELAP